MGSFDGSSKGFAGIGQNINYHEAIETPHMKHVIEQAMRNASPEAIAFLDPLHPKKPDRIDASGLTEEEWKRRRVRSIGSSAASHVFGECPYPGTTNLDLYYEKTGQVPPPTKLEAELAELCDKYGIDPSMPDSKKRQWHFDFGHIAEDIMHRYCEYLWPGHELIVDTNIYSSPARPFLTANLDRMMKLRDGSYIHVEFKTASAENKDGWRKPVLDPNTGEYFEEWAIPQHYKRQLIQCQHIMGVWESVLVVMFDRDNIIPITYYRDLDEEMYQVKVCEDFWMNHVLTRVPPDLLLGDPKNLASCIRRYSGEADAALQTVSLPREFLEDVKKIEGINSLLSQERSLVRELEEEQAEAMLPLIEALGRHYTARVTDGKEAYSLSYKPRRGQRKIDFEQLRLNHPEIYAEYVSYPTEASRSMRIKKEKIG